MPRMRTIHVTRPLRAPIEQVFAVLADHEGYVRFPGVRSCTLTQTGTPDRNGLGAIREVDLGAAWFREEITAYAPPTRLEYRILKSRPPIEHALGRITLTPTAEGCEVQWVSTFRITTPVIGGLMTVIAQRRMSRAFARVLAVSERLAKELRGTS